MCIIAVKKPGVPFPSEETIENMWYSNPDGAGIMYTDGSNRVTIDKGYMTLKEFEARLEALRTEIDVDKEAVVFHFRITGILVDCTGILDIRYVYFFIGGKCFDNLAEIRIRHIRDHVLVQLFAGV